MQAPSSLELRFSGLMRKSLAGDAMAYRMLLDELSRHLRAYFVRRLGRDRTADAEDLVQDTLMAVHSRRATYEIERPFTAWAHAIARYKLIDHLRQQRVRAAIPIDDADDLIATDDAEAASARMDVETLLGSIPARQSTLIRETKLEGRSIADMAAETGQSESAIKVSIHRGVKALAMRIRGR